MKLKDLLHSISPEVRRLSSKEEFKLSREIIRLRVKNGYDQKDFSQLCSIEHKKLVLMEFASESYGVEDYEEVLEKIKKVVTKF